MKRYNKLFSLIIISIWILSCSSGGGDDPTVTPSSPSTIPVTAGRATLTVTPAYSTLQNDGIDQVTLVAVLKDANGVGIKNQEITFTADRHDVIVVPPGATTTTTYPGYGVSPYKGTSITDANGKTSVTVRAESAGIRPGSCGILVEAPTGFNLKKLVTVNIVGAGVGGLYLSASPATITVGDTSGGSTEITVTVMSMNGVPMENIPVTLTIDGDRKTGITGQDGKFILTIYTPAACPNGPGESGCGASAGTKVRTITITARAGGVSKTIEVQVVHS